MAFALLHSDTVVIHGRRSDPQSPSPLEAYPGAALWVVTNAVPRYWDGRLAWSEVFNVHPETWRGQQIIPPATLEWYRSQAPDRPIWLREVRSDIPASAAFPIDALRRRFPREPFGCTDDYLIAFAIARLQERGGRKRIVLDGIGTTDDPLFQFLHRTVWHWIGYARGAGIDLIVHEPSCFRTSDLYGFERLGFAEQDRFVAAWNSHTEPDERLIEPLAHVVRLLAQTSTLNPIYAESVIESARAYFRRPQHDSNGGR